jgi:transposase-like protein
MGDVAARCRVRDQAVGGVAEARSFPRRLKSLCWLHELCAGASHHATLRQSNRNCFDVEVKRHTEIVGIFPNEDAIVHLVGAILIEPNDEWIVQRAT